MTSTDPLTATSHTCRRCHQPVKRVRDVEIGIQIDLHPAPLPVTVPLPAHRVLYEHHPRFGWHAPSTPSRRGFPLHLIHTCKNATESEPRP